MSDPVIELVTTIKGRRIVSGFTLKPGATLVDLTRQLANADKFLQHVADLNGVVHNPWHIAVQVHP